MRVIFAVTKGLVAYGIGLVYLAHLLAADAATEVAKRSLDE
jgi:hypothetical protein